LSERFGARHLAGAPQGRGLHWRTFTSALDAAKLSQDAEARVVGGAAFARVRGLVETLLPMNSEPKANTSAAA
jgi:heme oxygenase